MVYVLDIDGKQLMPTERTAWVAYALKHGEAKVVRREPFTIRLLRPSTHYLQAVTLGVDAGSRHVGLSATTEKKELYSAQVELRSDVSQLLTARREMRRGRRGRRHNWYRPARWANRANEEGNAELPPSIRHKAESHMRAIAFVRKFLPIAKIRVELGKFDSQKIANPAISGVEYQQGTLAGWENLKAYAKWRDGQKCRACGKSAKDGARLEVHHIRRRADGGSDTPDNVVTLCHECHEAHHQKQKVMKLKRPPVHRNEAHMNAMRKYLRTRLVMEYGHSITVEITYGYETAVERRAYSIEKSHANDAFCIAQNFHARRNGYNHYFYRHVRSHNRCLHKSTVLRGGYRKANQAPREVFGFRLNDVVRYKGKNWFVHGRRIRGSFVLSNLGMTEKAEVSCRKIRLLHHVGTQLTERSVRNSPQP